MAGKRRTFGTIRKLTHGSGRWQASYVGPDGKRHTAPTTYVAKKDADGWLAREHGRIVAEGPRWRAPGAVDPKGITLALYSSQWLDGRRVKGEPLRERTRSLYADLLRLHILPVLGDRPLSEITPAVVRTWHAGITTGPTRTAHCYSLLHAILSTAVSDELLDANPCRIRGAMATAKRRELDPLTADELTALADAMPSESLAVAVLLMGWCALRVGELRALRVSDVADGGVSVHVSRSASWRGGQWHVGAPKTDAGVRSVALPPRIRARVAEYVAGRRGNEILVPSPVDSSAYLGDWELRREFTKAARVIGREGIRIHDLRHTGATIAAMNGATTMQLMRRLGHTTPIMAMRYQHATDSADDELARRMG